MKIKYGNIFALALFLFTQSLLADEIITTDGARLVGEITLIDKGTITLETAYAGTLKIKQEQVASFSTEQPRVVRLESGTIMAGPVQSSGNGKLKITSEDGVLETSTNKIAASWSPDSEDPEVKRNRREWRYDASLDVTGKDGNSDKFRLGAGLDAKLKGPNDTLAFFLEYEQAEDQDVKTEDRAAGGASYESFFSKILGWYARTELETDRIDDIEFRSTSAAGLSYRLINKDKQSLVLRSGLGYRYTSFTDQTMLVTIPITLPEGTTTFEVDIDGGNESSATIDFGLAHTYEFKDFFVMENNITFVPSIDDFSDYRLVHDSGIEVPIGTGDNWKIRMGIKHEYQSVTTADEKLDTSYYTRMIYSWR